MTKKQIAIYFFPVLMFIACSPEVIIQTPLNPEYDESVEFVLNYEETQYCSCSGPDISFTQLVEESRCPSSVVCVWGGQVIVNLNIGGQDIELGLSSNNAVQAKDTIGQWTVELLEVRPYPAMPADLEVIDSSAYELDLIIESL